MLNLSLYTVTAFLILDSDGHRVLAKYYRPANSPLAEAKGLITQKEQKAFEKGLWDKTRKAGGDIILFEGHLAIYKHSTDLIFYVIGSSDENELMLSLALNTFHDALSVLLRNQIEKRAVLECYDLTMLCLDETIDEGIIIETDSTAVASRVSRPRADPTDLQSVLNRSINEQSLKSAYQTVVQRIQQL